MNKERNEEPATPSQPTGESKILVDEDWKTQVEREKEALRQSADDAPTVEKKSSDIDGARHLPPVSFAVLVSTLATQAMAGLGLIPDPMTGKPTVDRPMAKHFIDTLAMLEVKTKGNLDDNEAAQLRDGLHQLRMIYLSMPAGKAEEKPTEPVKSKLELP